MSDYEAPFDESLETESRRLTPAPGLDPADSSNEDFLFHLYRGSELLQDNRVHEAKEELEQALHLQPRDSKGQDLLGVVYFRLGLHTRAIQVYEQLRRRNPNDSALLLNLALCYLKTGQPQAARRDLELLLATSPAHARAWGYLGIACERLGDLVAAERAFAQGGHGQMAKRLAARREGRDPGPAERAAEKADGRSDEAAVAAQAVRAVAGAAYRELDAGELTFALADPTSDQNLNEPGQQKWQPIEPGHVRFDEIKNEPPKRERTDPRNSKITDPPSSRDGAVISREAARYEALRPEAQADVSRIPAFPQFGQAPTGPNRRPTLIAPVGAPPAPHEPMASELTDVNRIPSHRPPFLGNDVGTVRRPVVAVASPYSAARANEASAEARGSGRRRGTLAPPHGTPSGPREEPTKPEPLEPDPPAPASPYAPHGPQTPLGIGPDASTAPMPPTNASAAIAFQQAAHHAASSERAPNVATTSQEPIRFPSTGVALHRSGVALVQTTDEAGFAARLESIRTQQSGMKLAILERNMKGRPNGESFGGVASPMVLASGAGQLVLAARPGRKLFLLVVEGEMCFAREDILLGFGGGLAYENGRLATGEGEYTPVVQLKGTGGILLEPLGEVLTLPVSSHRSLSVRREVIVGWFGRLVPRSLPPSDATCGQRGLVSFAGEGKVLVTSV